MLDWSALSSAVPASERLWRLFCQLGSKGWRLLLQANFLRGAGERHVIPDLGANPTVNRNTNATTVLDVRGAPDERPGGVRAAEQGAQAPHVSPMAT